MTDRWKLAYVLSCYLTRLAPLKPLWFTFYFILGTHLHYQARYRCHKQADRSVASVSEAAACAEVEGGSGQAGGGAQRERRYAIAK